MSEPWEWGYICPYCEERFSAHPLLIQHMMDEHNFKPTKNSHTARYWRHFYRPLSEAEKKLEAIKVSILDAQNRFSIRGLATVDADDELKIMFRGILNEIWSILVVKEYGC